MDIICMPDNYRVYIDGEFFDIPYEYVDAPKTISPHDYIDYLMEAENMTYREVVHYLLEHAPNPHWR
ncbi:MAG: hypothetical protein R3321_08700 [Nitrososphaeraceae archaeon]|nr:hypothetical protein [Nitrososphaeraceae archaeon]